MNKLYVIPRCPFGHRAVIAMREKQLPFELVFFDPQRRPPELDAVGRYAKSPTLFDGTDRIYDSLVVLEYLEDRYGEVPLLPQGPATRAEVRSFVTRVSEELAPKLGAIAGAAFEPKRDPAKVEAAAKAFVDCLGPWDERLAGRSFAVGDAFTLADIVLYTVFPAAQNLANASVPPSLGHLSAWLERMAARPTTAVQVRA